MAEKPIGSYRLPTSNKKLEVIYETVAETCLRCGQTKQGKFYILYKDNRYYAYCQECVKTDALLWLRLMWEGILDKYVR